MKKKTFTINELCEIMNLRPASIRLKIKKGELKSFKTGRDWQITIDDFKKYLRESIHNKEGIAFMLNRVDEYLCESTPEPKVAQYEETAIENTATPEIEATSIDTKATTPIIREESTPIVAKKTTLAPETERVEGTKATTPVVATVDDDDPVKVRIIPSTMIEFLKRYEMKRVVAVEEIDAMIKSKVLISMKQTCEILQCQRAQLSRYETKYLHVFRFFLSEKETAQFQCFYFAKEVEELSKIPRNQRHVDAIAAPVYRIDDNLRRQIDNGELIHVDKKQKNINGRSIESIYKMIRMKQLRAIRINRGGGVVSTYVFRDEIKNFQK